MELSRRSFCSGGLALLSGLLVAPAILLEKVRKLPNVSKSVYGKTVPVVFGRTRLKNVLVLIADGTPDGDNEVIDASTLLVPTEKVSVRRNYKELIGTAELRREGNRVFADIELSASVTGTFTPAIGGMVKQKAQTLYDVIKATVAPAPSRLFGCSIDGLGFCESSNSDPRISSITL
jgi:hypothetical protein